MTGESPWRLSWRADPVTRAIADRHYNRQKPGAAQFVPPGRCLVLRTADGTAAWTTSWPFAAYVQQPGARIGRRSEPMPDPVPVPGWQPSLFDLEAGDAA